MFTIKEVRPSVGLKLGDNEVNFSDEYVWSVSRYTVTRVLGANSVDPNFSDVITVISMDLHKEHAVRFDVCHPIYIMNNDGKTIDTIIPSHGMGKVAGSGSSSKR